MCAKPIDVSKSSRQNVFEAWKRARSFCFLLKKIDFFYARNVVPRHCRLDTAKLSTFLRVGSQVKKRITRCLYMLQKKGGARPNEERMSGITLASMTITGTPVDS